MSWVDVQAQGSAAATFLTSLQRAVDAHDRRTVATLVQYPATVLASGFNIPVKDSAALLMMYDVVFTPEMRCAIAESGFSGAAGASTPKYPVVMSSNTLTIAGGLVAARATGDRFRIVRLTTPPSTVARIRRAPVRVTFPGSTGGGQLARFAGRLSRDDIDSYLVTVRNKNLLTAQIEGFRGHDATLHVTEASLPLSAEAVRQDAGRVVSQRSTTDTTYRVDVVRLAAFCAPDLLYRLSISLR